VNALPYLPPSSSFSFLVLPTPNFPHLPLPLPFLPFLRIRLHLPIWLVRRTDTFFFSLVFFSTTGQQMINGLPKLLDFF